jgi:predicted lipoprotein
MTAQSQTPKRRIVHLPRLAGRGAFALALLAAVVVYCVVDTPVVVESLNSAGGGSAVAGSQNLSPAKYVESIWSAKILPTAEKDSVQAQLLLAALRANPAAAEKRYGHYAVEGGPPSFLVRGSGYVTAVHPGSLGAAADVAFAPAGKPAFSIQLGPILTGTDVRDALPFINFNQFVNQVQYGQVAVAINAKITQTALAKLTPAKLKGQHVSFTGAFTFAGAGAQVLTPITRAVAK